MLSDLVPLAGLVVLLAVAYLHPRARAEAAIGLVVLGATLSTGALSRPAVSSELHHLGPVVGFLVAILVVAECCRVDGLFRALGARLGVVRGRQRLLTLTFLTAVAVTLTLSLDATVVLLTPVVLAATATRFLAGELACVRLANSASLLLPVANLTNLLAMPYLHLSFARFALLMAPSWVVVLLVEYAVLRTRHRVALREPMAPTHAALPAIPRFPIVVIALMLAGFVAASPLQIAPAWAAASAAVVLAGRNLARGQTAPRTVLRSAHASFAIYVLCLGLVVAALGAGSFGDQLRTLVPHRPGLVGLLLVAALGAVLANVVNNLPAILLLLPLVAPLGTTSLLALLIGINVGASMTWTGSLANLLWRRTLIASGRRVPSREFHLTGAIASPLAIVAGVVVLNWWQLLLG